MLTFLVRHYVDHGYIPLFFAYLAKMKTCSIKGIVLEWKVYLEGSLMTRDQHQILIEASLENIRKAHNENYLSIFADAGISADSGLPKWRELSRRVMSVSWRVWRRSRQPKMPKF